MVSATKLAGALQGDNIKRLLYYCNQLLIACWVAVKYRDIFVRPNQGKGNRAGAHPGVEPVNGLGQLMVSLARRTQKMVRIPLGSTRTNTRE